MSSIRLDNIIFSTLHEAYKNYETLTDTIVVAATALANGASRTITVNIPYTRGGTRADTYATRGTLRALVTSGGRSAATAVYNFKSTETVAFGISYSSSNIAVSLTITNNTGGSITPNAQSIVISVVKYEAPIADI